MVGTTVSVTGLFEVDLFLSFQSRSSPSVEKPISEAPKRSSQT